MPQKREKREAEPQRRVTYPKDKSKLHVADYLISIYPKKVTRSNIMNHAKIRKQNDTEFKKFMREMVIMKWAEVVEHTKPDGTANEYYGIIEEGRDAVNEAKKIVREDSPLAKLEVFEDMLDL